MTLLIAWFLEMCLPFRVVELRLWKPVSNYETLANSLLCLLLAVFLLCNCSVLHVVLSVATVTRYRFHLCMDGPRTTKSFEDSCVNILRGNLHAKNMFFSRVCTVLSLHRKVLKIKISFQEHVQGINKRGQIHHWSVFYIPHLNEVILFSVTLVSMFVSLWKQFSDFRQSFFSDSSLLSETHTRSSLPACHFLFSKVANLGCLPKLCCLSAIVFLWR